MEGDEQKDVGGSRKRKKSSLGKVRSKKQSVASMDTPGPSAVSVAEMHGVGSSLQKPSLTDGADANLLPAAVPAATVAEPSKAPSSHRSARSEKRRKQGSKTSSTSSSSSASSLRSKKGATEDSSKATTPQPAESKESHDPTRRKDSREEVALDGRSGNKTSKTSSTSGAVALSSSTHERQTSSAAGASRSPLAQLANIATSGVFLRPGGANKLQHDKTITVTTSDSSPTHTEQGSSSSGPAGALTSKDKGTDVVIRESKDTGKTTGTSTSCSVQPDTEAPAAVYAVLEYQDQIPANMQFDNTTTNAAAAAPVVSEDRRASASPTPRSKDASLLNQGQAAGQTAQCEDALKEEQLIQPTARPMAPKPLPLPADDLEASGRREKQKRGDHKHERARDSKYTSGAGSEAQADDAQRKTGLGSTANWSFYPGSAVPFDSSCRRLLRLCNTAALNVTFVTEMESRDERLLFGAVVAAIAVVFSLLIAGLVLLLYTKRVTSPLACVTAECLAARDYLVHLLNTSKDACSDFYGYVCDSWLARGPDGGSFHGDSVTASLARINESLWNQEGEEGESEDTRLVRRVYRQCHRYASDRPTTTSLKETLRSARKQLNWAKMAACRHYHELVALLVQTSLLVGLHSVMVLEILSEDDRAVMRVSRGRSLHRKLMSTSDHRGNLEAIFRTVMEDEAKDLPKILEIDALAERDLGVADSTGTEPSEEAHGLLEEFLDGLVPSVKATNWLAAVNGVLMPLDTYTMRISDLALASGIDSIRKVFKSITTQHGIADIALYLASHLDAEVLAIELSRSQVSSDRANTAHFCLELVLRSYAFLWPQHAPRLPKSGRRQEVLETMYSQLQGASKGSIMFTWLPKEMRPYAEEKVKKVGLSVVSEDMLSKTAWMDEEDPAVIGSISETEGNFVELYLKVLSVTQERRLRSPPTFGRFAISRLERRSELAYSRTTQTVVVPTAYQSPPYL
ncbi:hypothetical protein V5799_012563, partial [Amblyomma americanum]